MFTYPSYPPTTAHTRPRDRAGRSSIAPAIVLLALVLVVLAPRTALAHDQLVSSSPAKDSTTDSVPAQIELVLSAAPLATGAQLVLTTPDGDTIPAEEPAVKTTQGAVTFPVTGDGPPGTYTVAWHVVSSDGHPIEGTFDFTVKPDTAEAEASPSPSTTDPSATGSPVPDTQDATPPETQQQSATAAGTSDQPFLDPLMVVVVAVVVTVAVLVVVTFLTRRRDSAHEPAGPPGDLLDDNARE